VAGQFRQGARDDCNAERGQETGQEGSGTDDIEGGDLWTSLKRNNHAWLGRGPVKNVNMSVREFSNGHGPPPGQLLDVVVGTGHVSMLVVDHRAAEMLNDVGRHAHRLERRAILVDRRILEHNLSSKRDGEFNGHLLMIHLDRTGYRYGRS
jgi:hypothetical protein